MQKFDLEELRTSSEAVHDLIVQDRSVEFTRRYYVARLRRDLTPLSKPEDSAVCEKVYHPARVLRAP